jgi:hypothetical protein
MILLQSMPDSACNIQFPRHVLHEDQNVDSLHGTLSQTSLKIRNGPPEV